MSRQFTLGKNERLKSRKQIEQLFNEGKSFVANPFSLYFFVHGSLPMDHVIRFGVGVSSKNFKKAVDRNRVKRLTREAWRLQKNDPEAIGLKERLKTVNKQLNVFFIYTGKELPDFRIMKVKVGVALKTLADKIDENISKNS